MQGIESGGAEEDAGATGTDRGGGAALPAGAGRRAPGSGGALEKDHPVWIEDDQLYTVYYDGETGAPKVCGPLRGPTSPLRCRGRYGSFASAASLSKP